MGVKPFVQSEITKKFLEIGEDLIKAGTVKDFSQIAAEIKLNESSLSLIKNMKRNLPHDIAKRFQEVYNIILGNYIHE